MALKGSDEMTRAISVSPFNLITITIMVMAKEFVKLTEKGLFWAK
jgi:hypothetical protein